MAKITISLIAAISKNYVIGKNNALPWKLPKDMCRFKEITLNSYVIMGKNNFYAIERKPLPKRKNIVLSASPQNYEGFIFFCNLKEAILYCRKQLEQKESSFKKEIFIIGGSILYKSALEQKVIDKIYLTVINKHFSGDVFFPPINLDNWSLKNKETIEEKELTTNEVISYENYIYLIK